MNDSYHSHHDHGLSVTMMFWFLMRCLAEVLRIMANTQNIVKTPNPQGKGLVPVLAALTEAGNPGWVPLPKSISQIANELFTSMFVLESRFSFKPVPQRSYWLYRDPLDSQGRFSLSLLSPEQWSATVYGQVIGHCVLQADLTWTLELSDEAAADNEMMAYIAERRRRFGQELAEAKQVDDLLPVFQHNLPFYQRVFASALAGSLSCSMQQAGIAGLSYEQAAGLLGHDHDN